MADRERASNDELAALHGVLADHFVDILKNGRKVELKDKETGEVRVVTLTPDAALFNQIRQFLRDNDIKSMPGTNKKIASIVDSLPTFTDDDSDPTPTGVTH